ncbi:hypothetical protein DMENIID0001_162100 [Sergentomyia squamirostris]
MSMTRVYSSGILLIAMITVILAGKQKDRVHLKIHIPEVIKKHIHTRTVIKHHYHKVPMHGHGHGHGHGHFMHPPPPLPHHTGHATQLEPTINLGPAHHHHHHPINPMFHTGPGTSAAGSIDVKVPWIPKHPMTIIPVAPLPPKLVEPLGDVDYKGGFEHSMLDDTYELGSDEYLKNTAPVSLPDYDTYKPIYNRPPTNKFRHQPELSTSYSATLDHSSMVKHPDEIHNPPRYTTPMSVTSTSYSHQLHYFPSAGEEDVAIPVKTRSKHPVWYVSTSGSSDQDRKVQPAKAMETDDFSHFDNILTTKPKSVITKYGTKVPLKDLTEIRRRVRKLKSPKRNK